MFHADYILLQSRPFDKTSVINKFEDLVYDVLGQLKLEHLDRLVYSARKHVPDINLRNNLIDGIISSRCGSYKKIFSNLSINEQFYILAHLNLDLLSPKVEDPNPVFVRLISSFVRELLISG
ncbi:MAG: hypothetical protein K0R14_1665 [Burkholderiales bacterium]|jgi:hypothetical protein|nr:hypothetical protein [Burkholderiales bacterium]